jgi:hypothetical protein
MSRQTKRKLIRALATFNNEDLGLMVISYLNRTNRPAGDPVEKLVNLAEHLASRQDVVNALLEDASPVDVAQELADHINDTNTKWEFRTYAVPATNAYGKRIITERCEANYNKARPDQVLEWNRCLVLLRREMLDRIRHCQKQDCRKLFWARYAHGEYCSDACRLEDAANNPIYRERRAEHMRQYRKAAKKAAGR